MILVLGGTSEGRELASYLQAEGFSVLLTVTTPLAKAFASENIKVRVGKLSGTQLHELLITGPINAVIDATHPFAEEISALAFKVTQNLAIPYFRFERPKIDYSDKVILTDNFNTASQLSRDSKVFSAIGIRRLKNFISSGNLNPHNLVVRVLPDSLQECLELGIPKENIFTGIGPFSYEDNHQLFLKTGVEKLITKASGPNGGEEEKLKAASELDLQVIVIQRPPKKGRSYANKKDILQALRRINMKTGLLVLAHGSKRQQTKETLAEIVEIIKQKGNFEDVAEAFLQFNTPTLQDAVGELAKKGVEKIIIAPYFLFKGIHNTEDIPNEIASLKNDYPNIEFALTEPLGTDERLAAVLLDRVQEVM